ncbi:FtsX-like permease family protein [Aeromicrobium sp. Leaf350]|uniref:FtsX-like permease family protein n=1 Tax=Aeromicrobium sp. Leaf350 TaxID=2876565 RepID=UPI001E3D33D2|nr:ABC transporter permease [Aeromicrobium sp. Leaf350]
MRTVLLASLRVHTRRYVAAVLAVGLAVAFVVATDALSTAARSGLNAGVGAPYAAADLVVGESYGISTEDQERAVDSAEAEGAAAWTIGRAWEQITSEDGRQLDAEASIGTVDLDADHRWQEVVEGRAPRAADEALVDQRAATSREVAVGDTLTIGSGPEALTVTVVGIAAPAAYLSAPVYVPWDGLRALPTAQPETVLVAAPDDRVDAVAETITAAVDTSVSTTDAYVDQRRTQVNDGIDVVSYLVLVFAAVAAFVAVLVVANTFTILFAQRSRDLALLRAVGARKRQLLRAVRLEALAIGVLASALGLLAGAIGGWGIAAVVRAFAGAERIGAVGWSPAWLVGAFVGGVVVTVVASWWPTRAVVRISPLAALRPDEPTHARSAVGRRRIVLGAAVLALGAVPLAVGTSTMHVQLAILGSFTTFVGVLVLGPVVVPAVIRLLGRLVGRTGATSRLAVDNAVRNPRRTAATTASLLVGVTLTATVLTVMATGRGAMEAELDGEYPVDLVLSSTTAASAEVLERVRSTPEVESAAGVPGTTATAGDLGELAVLAPGEAALDIAHDDGAALAVEPGEVLVPYDVERGGDVTIPERLTLTGPAGVVELATRLVPSRWGGALVVAPATLEQLTPEAEMQAVWARAEAGANPDDLGGSLGLVAREGGLDLANQLDRRAWVDVQLDILVGAVVGLLGIAVLIALAGIGNTLGLSVLERGRENALVRALGLTRGQLRRSLGVEGLLLAAAAGLLGTALGIGYAWAGVRTVIDVAVPDATMVIPFGQLALVVLAAAAAGVVACIVPARRAGRIAPAEGLVAD